MVLRNQMDARKRHKSNPRAGNSWDWEANDETISDAEIHPTSAAHCSPSAAGEWKAPTQAADHHSRATNGRWLAQAGK
jgi:hypothetical protein